MLSSVFLQTMLLTAKPLPPPNEHLPISEGFFGTWASRKNHSFFPSRNQTEKLHMPPHFYDFGESSASLQRISYMDVESCVIGVLGSSQYRKTQQTVEI